VWCWGGNGNGQLGSGTRANQRAPSPVKGLSGVVEIGGGQYSTCARTTEGEVSCWGFLGCDCDEGRHHQMTPKVVRGLPRALSLHMGPKIICITSETGEVHCWNHHTYAREFSPPSRGGSTRRPWKAPLTESLAALAPGESHVCALTATDEVRCWGDRDIIGDEPRRGLFIIEPP
jgi:alpha-tubulin suppressor-like RCC1 family protein